MLHWFSHRVVQTIFVLTLFAFSAPYLPLEAHRLFYTISLFIKDILVWMMPVTVCFFIANTIISFKNKAVFFVAILALFEATSNLLSVWYAFFMGSFASEHLPAFQNVVFDKALEPLWRQPFSKPSWWGADKGCFVGLMIGLLLAFSNATSFIAFVEKGKNIAQTLLTKFFARLIPLFILGFAAHMYKTEIVAHVFAHYDVLVVWLLGTLFLYLAFLFVASGGGLWKGVSHLKNMLPAGGIAFTSGCSLSTMPSTIRGASLNLKNPNLAEAIIPATTNIQQVGDCIVNSFLCFLIYKQFNGVNPEIAIWLPFSIAFTIARFATAAVIGGAIFEMLPIYEQYLGFSPDMIAIILAFNVILDPLVTSSNVLSNGALCRVFERAWERATNLFKERVDSYQATKS